MNKVGYQKALDAAAKVIREKDAERKEDVCEVTIARLIEIVQEGKCYLEDSSKWEIIFSDSSIGRVIRKAFYGDLNAAVTVLNTLIPGRGCAFNLEAGYAAVYGKGIEGRLDGKCQEFPARAMLIAILKGFEKTNARTY